MQPVILPCSVHIHLIIALYPAKPRKKIKDDGDLYKAVRREVSGVGVRRLGRSSLKKSIHDALANQIVR